MRIQLVGFANYLTVRNRQRIICDVINNSNADLILFPGHTLRNPDDLEYLQQHLRKRNLVAIFELEESWPSSVMRTTNELIMYKNGKITDMYTSQLFSTNRDLQGKKALMEKFFDELPRRQFEWCEKLITIILCGENSFLSGSRKKNLEADFRFKDETHLLKRFNQLLTETDLFLNPIHSIQGEQGVMSRRRKLLSSEGRYYFSTSFLGDHNTDLSVKSLQYAWHNGVELSVVPEIHEKEGYVLRFYEIG